MAGKNINNPNVKLNVKIQQLFFFFIPHFLAHKTFWRRKLRETGGSVIENNELACSMMKVVQTKCFEIFYECDVVYIWIFKKEITVQKKGWVYEKKKIVEKFEKKNEKRKEKQMNFFVRWEAMKPFFFFHCIILWAPPLPQRSYFSRKIRCTFFSLYILTPCEPRGTPVFSVHPPSDHPPTRGPFRINPPRDFIFSPSTSFSANVAESRRRFRANSRVSASINREILHYAVFTCKY